MEEFLWGLIAGLCLASVVLLFCTQQVDVGQFCTAYWEATHWGLMQ